MPRRKAQGINLQKRTVVVKSQNSAHNKKTLNFEKTKDTNDCIKQSPVKTPNRVPEFTTISTTEKNVDIPNDSYLHKKFKKVAEISASIAKTEKTEIKVKNGFGNDDRKGRFESYNIDLVPKVEERILNNYNVLDVKSEDVVLDAENTCRNDDKEPQAPAPSSVGSTSPVPKVERTKSPLSKKEDVHLSANPGRYVCSYCQLACAKPSVLQKHIRAHTNERPYPCSPCGFAFKTKSNLYKHCRSQAHRFKTGESQTGSEKCDSGEEMSDDSSSNPADFVTCKSDVEPQPAPAPTLPKTSEGETNENQHKIYKPKFHKAALYQDETESLNVTPKVQDGLSQKKAEGEAKPKLKIPLAKDPLKPGVQSPLFGNKNLTPSPEFLHQHISKIISDNQAIVETMEPQWTKKFLQRQNSRDKEMASPLSNVSSPGVDHYQKYNSDAKKKDETKSKLALALLKVDKNEVNRYSSAYPKTEVNSDNHTYQPLNLTKKDSEDKVKYQTLGGSTIKEILIKSREAEAQLGQYSPMTMAEILSSLQTCKDEMYPKTKLEVTSYYPNQDSKSPEKEPMSVEAPHLSPGPLLGSTPLVEVKTDSGPPPKKRRIHSTSYQPESDLLYRRLSLPCTMNGCITSPNRPSSSPSTTLKSLEELSKHPMKTSLNMFGGEVKILDCGETKTLRIESLPNQKIPIETTEDNSKLLVTFAKTGLHSGGGTLVQVPATAPQSNSFQMASILNYPDTSKLILPIIPKISTPNITVTGIPPPTLSVPQDRYAEGKSLPTYVEKSYDAKENFDKVTSHNGGILTIVHGGKQIPYVPGIPGPQTVLPSKVTESVVKNDVKEPTTTTPTKSTVSSLISVRKLSSSNQPKNVPNDIPKIEISSPKSESRKEELTSKGESGLKFLRPTSLPLRPGSFTPKRLHQGITPTVLSLVSPETPRPKKSYAQLFLNGHAYTYLGLKCSTRSYYCTISRPQPMYVVQSPQHPKLSMYSNWKVYSESEPSLLGLTPAKAIAHYDSRHRTSAYTIADKHKASGSTGIVTHSSSWLKPIDKQPMKDDNKSENNEGTAWSGEAAPKRVKIFAGGYASNEDYTYVRGRGRGRYVCEECGIRCKKPSMLKKHIRTHTDVRPYTCKHCTFSFKTKGNLTKHMKSKAHYKKCMEMNISPIPTTVEAENIDEELLLQQQALRQDGNEESENEEEDDEEESDGGEEEETTTEDPESLEREAACSLLSLSETTTRSSQYKSLYIAAGLIPKNLNGVRPSTYPYVTAKIAGIEEQTEKETSRLDETSQSYTLPKEKIYDNERPIDLSQKESKSDVNFLSKDSEFLANPRHSEVGSKPSVSSNMPVPAYLLASITNAGVQYDKINSDLAGSHMLQAYLTAKALHDVKIKQQQNHKSRFGESNETETENVRQFDTVSQLHQNFCRVYEKTIENESVNLKRFREERNGLGVLSPALSDGLRMVNVSEKSSDICPRVSLGDLNVNKLVEINKLDEGKQNEGKSDGMEEKVEAKTSEKSDNVSVTVETSSGKMILVSFPPAESERLNSPPTGFLSKPGDNKLKAEFFPPSSGPSPSYVSVTEDGRSICVMCNKIFTKASQLKLHVNIHYFERPFRCEACAVSFRTKGHLLKHERSGSHHNKVSMNTTFGTATTSNPRPFKCDDCKIAFRIHGHLAKHLRSKMHIMKLECIGKLPFGTYAEMERSGVNLNEIDTTDCENSLESLQVLAQKLYEKDPSKLGQLENSTTKLNHSTNEDEVTNSEREGGVANEGDSSSSDGYQFSLESPEKHNEESNELVCNNSRVSIKKEVLHYPEQGMKCRSKPDKHHPCTVCEEKFDNLTSLQVHLFAEHNRDIKIDLLNKVNGKSNDNIEKSIKSNEETLIDTEKGK